MANPRPCVCGHPRTWHAHQTGFCWEPGSIAIGLRCRCPFYRPAPRKEPLRASRWLFPSGRKGIVIFSNGARWPIMVQPAPASTQAHSTFTVQWNDDRHAYEVRDSDGPA